MRRGAGLAVIGCAVLAAGCGQTPAASTAAATPRATAQATATATATPEVTPVGPPQLIVVVAGAGAAASGTIGVAVVRNPSHDAAVEITVVITAASANGKASVSARTTLLGLAGGETQAVAIPLAIPANDAVGDVTASATAVSAGTYTNPLAVVSTEFTSADLQPEVIVTLAGPGSPAVKADVVAVCYAKAGHLLGGGAVTRTANGAGSATIVVGITDTPDHCDGFAHPT